MVVRFTNFILIFMLLKSNLFGKIKNIQIVV